jgi:hypothetical protein
MAKQLTSNCDTTNGIKFDANNKTQNKYYFQHDDDDDKAINKVIKNLPAK